MLVVCKYIVPSVPVRVASEEECQGSSSPMSGAGRMLVTLTPRTLMPMAKDVFRYKSPQYIQLGRPSVNPPGLVVEAGGTST